MTTHAFKSEIRNPKSGITAFTLIELLVVIGIIVVLAGILLPVVGQIRLAAHSADTQAQINSIGAAMQAYYGDFNAYPGPIANQNLRASGITGITAANMSMAENLYLGMLGGLTRTSGAGVTPATFGYDATKAGQGPRWLGTSPKKLPAYIDNVNVSTGAFMDSNETPATDTVIPEFVDRFPETLPLLYLRARSTRTTGTTATDNPVVTKNTNAGAYDLNQVVSYTAPSATNASIGVGKNVDKSDYKVPADYGDPANPKHGLRDVVVTATVTQTLPNGSPDPNYTYPFDLYPALVNRSASTATVKQPKQKDGFILISAGPDRVYGTRDDITNFGSY